MAGKPPLTSVGTDERIGAVTAHWLNSQLQSITASAALVRLSTADPDRQQRAVDDIVGKAHAIGAVVRLLAGPRPLEAAPPEPLAR